MKGRHGVIMPVMQRFEHGVCFVVSNQRHKPAVRLLQNVF
jgi:hypothetical protein